jgi:hypothetical protein
MKQFNYTNRIDISPADVVIRLQGDLTDKPVIDIDINLSDYGFRENTLAYLEAQQQTRRWRRELGVLQTVIKDHSIPINEFDDAEGMQFRLKVVDEQSGRLLGFVDNVKPYNKNNLHPDSLESESILPVVSIDLEPVGPVWRVNFESGNAVLEIDRSLGDKAIVTRSILFRGFILPEVLRRILERVIYVEASWDEELSNKDEFSTKWLLFAMELGAKMPPDRSVSGSVDYDPWIDEIIHTFVLRQQVRSKAIDGFRGSR